MGPTPMQKSKRKCGVFEKITQSIEQSPYGNLTVANLVKTFPAFHGTRRFNFVSRTARQRTLSRAR